MIAFERYEKRDDLIFGFWEKEMVAGIDQWRIQKIFPRGAKLNTTKFLSRKKKIYNSN